MVNVVVADDEAAIRDSLKTLLERFGYKVRGAEDGAVALRLVEDDPPDLLVADLVMPQMSGDDLIARVRARYPSVKVIAISGAQNPAAVSSSVDVALAKPFTPDQLLATIDSLGLNNSDTNGSSEIL